MQWTHVILGFNERCTPRAMRHITVHFNASWTVHNIFQIYNSVLWGWQYSTKCSLALFHGNLSIPQNIVMNMNNLIFTSKRYFDNSIIWENICWLWLFINLWYSTNYVKNISLLLLLLLLKILNLNLSLILLLRLPFWRINPHNSLKH